jgi:glucose-fructose oxidoreductase
VILCPATAEHGLWTKRVAEYGVHVIVEKPFASSLAEADEMIAAQRATGKLLAINWPIRWYPAYITAKRLIDEGYIGEVLNVHHYGGNRGPLYHGADKVEITPTAEDKARSWFYKKAQGGGSLLDYAGYGATLGTWFQGGRKPLEITCTIDEPAGLQVDEHSITVARYAHGLSKIETRWGTFTDPWTHQPQPKCGFVICGTEGRSARMITPPRSACRRKATARFRPPGRSGECAFENPVQYVLHCLESGEEISGPLAPRDRPHRPADRGQRGAQRA